MISNNLEVTSISFALVVAERTIHKFTSLFLINSFMAWKRPVSNEKLFVTIIYANYMKFDFLWFDRSKLRKVQMQDLNGRTFRQKNR